MAGMNKVERSTFVLACLTVLLLVFINSRAPGQTRINPDQLKAPRVAVFTCTKAPAATADCAGLYYVDVVTAAGRELKIVGTVQPEAVNAADWSLVP